MEICAICASELDPSWKFCIKCGTPVPAGSAHRTRDETDVAEAAAPAVVPSAAPVAEGIIASAAAPGVRAAPGNTAAHPAPAGIENAPATRIPRRARSQFAPSAPTPSLISTEAAASTPEADIPEAIVREPVLPVPVIPEHKQSPFAPAIESDSEPAPEPARSPSIDDLAALPFAEDANPFSHDLPPRPEPPQTRAEAKVAAAERAAIRARATATAKAEIRAKYPIPSAAASEEYTDERGPAFRALDDPPTRRKIDVPLVVSIGLSTAGVILIVYLAILVFGARG